MNVKQTFFNVIFWTWCLPQSILGLIVYGVVKLLDRKTREERFHTGAWMVHTEKLGGGISLGYFIFSYDYKDATGKEELDGWYKAEQDKMDHHEWGHTLQGFILGPLYLLVIGLPSIVWATFFGNYRKKNNVSYYEFYSERWADSWGGVKR